MKWLNILAVTFFLIIAGLQEASAGNCYDNGGAYVVLYPNNESIPTTSPPVTYNYHAEVVGFDETFDNCWEDVHVKLYLNQQLVNDYGVVRVWEATEFDVDYSPSLSIGTNTFDLHTKGTDGVWGISSTTITVYRPPLSSVIAGPSGLDSGSWGKWYASAGGGHPPYTYYWEWMLLCDLSKAETANEDIATNMDVPCGKWNFGGTDDPYENTFYTEGDYKIRVTVTDSNSGTVSDDDYFTIYPYGTLNPVIGSGDADSTPQAKDMGGLEVRQNYPNPFNPQTAITFEIPKSQHVTLSICDVAGRLVERLINSSLSAGSHEVVWDATGYPSGAYIYRIETEAFVKTRMMNLVK